MVVASLAIFLWLRWQPERQVELHQRDFLQALEDRSWGKVRGMLAGDYSDRFGHDRETAVADAREVLRHFFALTIQPQGSRAEMGEGKAVVTVNLTISGTGTGMTEFITSEVNKLPDPWKFHWKKTAIWPWAWQLEKVDNASLAIRSM